MTFLEKTAVEQREALLNKEIKAVELLDLTYEQIDKRDEEIGAYNSLTKEFAYEIAKKVDEKIAKGEELPLLAGVPLTLKDNTNPKIFEATVQVSNTSTSSYGQFLVMDGFDDNPGRTYWKNNDSDFTINTDGTYKIALNNFPPGGFILIKYASAKGIIIKNGTATISNNKVVLNESQKYLE